MKKTVIAIIVALSLLFSISGCTDSSKLNPNEPVTLSVWHVYGEQADSPMNRLIQEFNETVGAEKGIVLNVTMMTNSTQIGQKLLDALKGVPGSGDIPDLFFCHPSNAAEMGSLNLLDWNDYFTQNELSLFIPDFINEGTIDERLSVLPVSKSTNLLFINGTQFGRFSKDTGITYDNLATWDGFFSTAEQYYNWSGGMAFCSFDYIIKNIELFALSMNPDIAVSGAWYDVNSPELKTSFDRFMTALIKGHIVISDLYSNTHVMTGDSLAGLGSCAAYLYYNDTVTYSDNTSEKINLKILPVPRNTSGENYVNQAGVGLSCYKTTEQKSEAASIFAHWLTDSKRNLDFVTVTGYMPVTAIAFEEINNRTFKSNEQLELYTALADSREDSIFLPESPHPDYFNNAHVFYEYMRGAQAQIHQNYLSGTDISVLLSEIWNTFCSVNE